MDVVTWRNLMGSPSFLVPNAIFAILTCCGPEPKVDHLGPNIGEAGSDLHVEVGGDNFQSRCGGDPRLIIDGFPNGFDLNHVASFGVSSDFDPTNLNSWGPTSIASVFHIDANARPGAHSIAVQTTEGISDPVYFTVTCQGCPPPPQLLLLLNDSTPFDPFNPSLIRGAPAVSIQIQGLNFLNHNPRLQVDGAGISFPPGPYTVHRNPFADDFVVPMTADANTYTGPRNVRVITDGGTSNPVALTVSAYRPPPPSPSPGSSPVLNHISPRHITKSSFGAVSIKFEGSGFGTAPQTVTDPLQSLILGALVEQPTRQANPDQVVVSLTGVTDPNRPERWVIVKVVNTQTGAMSNGQVLFLDDPLPGAPLVTPGGGFFIHRGGDADLNIFGENLDVASAHFYGIPGLTFSNIQQAPGIPAGQGLNFHVHSDSSTPLSGDEATNLILSTGNGQSNLFFLEVDP